MRFSDARSCSGVRTVPCVLCCVC
uniref:Uncharacterized protein n=1 Tax=Arundo donax TaxID=35708 RepID=A0A0A8YPC5_ARUDO